jgi:hypothetical protein
MVKHKGKDALCYRQLSQQLSHRESESLKDIAGGIPFRYTTGKREGEMRAISKVLISGLMVLALMACTHSLRITNEQNFAGSRNAILSKKVKLGFRPSDDKLVNSVIEELSLNYSVASVKKNLIFHQYMDFGVDYVCGLSKNIKFAASGQNFFITIPGFLIFTHAWLGYKYTIEIDTQSILYNSGEQELIQNHFITPYEIRYTSFPRGAAASLIGWFTPGFGLLNIIPGGIFASSYDTRGTAEFIDKVKPSYKTFISSKILDQINILQMANVSKNKTFRMEPVVLKNNTAAIAYNNLTRHTFVAHIMRIDGCTLNPMETKVVEISDATLTQLAKLTNGKDSFAIADLRKLVLEIGISDVTLPADIKGVSIYSLKNDKLLVLQKGVRKEFFMARRSIR